MVVRPMNRVFGEVHQGVVHPAHVPFEAETEAAQIGGSGHRRPRGRLLGDQHDRRVVSIDQLVGLFDEVDGLQVFPAAEPVGDPLAFLARVVQVEHGGDRVDA